VIRVDRRFASMGGTARVTLESDAHAEGELDRHAAAIHDLLDEVEAALSRFRADSELCALNRDPRPAVPASPLLRRLALAVRTAGAQSGGLGTRRCSVRSSARGTRPPAPASRGRAWTKRSPPGHIPRGRTPAWGSTRRAVSSARAACGSTRADSARDLPPTWRRRRCPRASATRSPAARGVSFADTLDHGWWLAARSAAIVAYLLLGASVVLGLAMALWVAPPRATPAMRTVHERIALVALGAVAAHTLLLQRAGPRRRGRHDGRASRRRTGHDGRPAARLPAAVGLRPGRPATPAGRMIQAPARGPHTPPSR
jgi:hypothetical protein